MWRTSSPDLLFFVDSVAKFHAAAALWHALILLFVPRENVVTFHVDKSDNETENGIIQEAQTLRYISRYFGGPVELPFCASCCTKLATRPIIHNTNNSNGKLPVRTITSLL